MLVSGWGCGDWGGVGVPSDKVLCFGAQLLIWREVEIPRPVDNLAISVVRLFSAERRPADETLKHNRTHAPPITAKVVALAAEDLGSNVIRRTDGGVSQLTPGLAPGVDLVAVGDGELNLVDGDGVAILRHGFGPRLGHELLVVGGGVFFGEAGGQPEVGEFDVSSAVEQDVVGFDVSAKE